MIALDHRERSDTYRGVIAKLSPDWRVIVCKDDHQWIIQRRTGSASTSAWSAKHYCRTREALMRLGTASCERIDPAALATLAALPEHFAGGAA